MNAIDTDIIRSMLIGQTIWVLVWLAFLFLLLLRLHLRPGAMAGCSLVMVGSYAALLSIMANALQNYGHPATWRTWLACAAVLCSSFGYVMLAFHLILHDDGAIAAIRGWFRKI